MQDPELPTKGGQGCAGTKPACVQKLRRPNFAGLNSGLSEAKLCRDPAVPLEAARQPLSPANPFLYEAKPRPGPCGHEWVKGTQVALDMSQGGRLLCRRQPGWSGAGLGKAELPLRVAPEGPSSLSAASWESWKAKPRHENRPHVCLKSKLLGALLQSLPERYKNKGSVML